MNVSNFIAKRYFVAKKSKNFIQILSWVSMVGVAFGTAALIIVLSVFNGLEDVIRSVYNAFDPDLKVIPVEGKSFVPQADLLEEIRDLEGVFGLSEVIEDKMLAAYRDEQVLATIKGVDSTFLNSNKLQSMASIRGELKVKDDQFNYAVLGAGVAYELGVLVDSDIFQLELLYPRRLRPGQLNSNAFQRVPLRSSAIFSLESNYDQSYIITSLDAAARAIGYRNQRTGLEIYFEPDADESKIKQSVKDILGSSFQVLDTQEQHAELLNSVKLEKLFAYIAITFITVIASFNVFFTLSMLAIEKRRDISVLYAFGATENLIKNVFLKQGAIIALTGGIVGLILGIGICLLQQEYGLVSIQMSTSMVQAYPVKLIWYDLLFVGVSVCLVTILTSYRPAIIATRVSLVEHLQ